MMSSLSYQIIASPDSNDHQVRLFVDGADWIGESHLGLDPPELVKQLTEHPPSRLIVARCSCGVLGCGDVVATLIRTAKTVEWSCVNRQPVVFDAEHFDNQIRALTNDHSWEPAGRTVERLLDEMFFGKVTDDGYLFEWSSTRFQPFLVMISVRKIQDQKLLEFSWDGETVANALSRGGRFLHERFGS